MNATQQDLNIGRRRRRRHSSAFKAEAVAACRQSGVSIAEPLDMRAGVDTALARVVSVFGEARSHHAYLFMNRRANRLKALVHDGFGLWLCARRLQQGQFVRASTHLGPRFELSSSQLQALVVGLPWERLNEHAKIHVL